MWGFLASLLSALLPVLSFLFKLFGKKQELQKQMHKWIEAMEEKSGRSVKLRKDYERQLREHMERDDRVDPIPKDE
jgi:hypothetical protein